MPSGSPDRQFVHRLSVFDGPLGCQLGFVPLFCIYVSPCPQCGQTFRTQSGNDRQAIGYRPVSLLYSLLHQNTVLHNHPKRCGRGSKERAHVFAGAKSQRLSLVGFFRIFLAETRKIPAGGTETKGLRKVSLDARIKASYG